MPIIVRINSNININTINIVQNLILKLTLLSCETEKTSMSN